MAQPAIASVEAKAPARLFVIPNSQKPPILVRELEPGQGVAVAKRTVFRPSDDNNWAYVGRRVGLGNASLLTLLGPTDQDLIDAEADELMRAVAKAALLMSGRHLQHGDREQPERNMEVFTNCSTAAMSSLLFYLLLNGSGVGRDYSDIMMKVDWAKQPQLVLAMRADHPDFAEAKANVPNLMTPEEALVAYEGAVTFLVPDSREGWAKCPEKLEVMAFQERQDDVLVMDFSIVREKGAPIRGMQNRPASGPAPLMRALYLISLLRGSNKPAWMLAMMVDHYLAECVLVGGARRSARMATKHWKDIGIVEFATFKNDYRDEFGWPIFYSSNNSVLVDAEFWAQEDPWAIHVFNETTYAAHTHDTGEPGFINVDKLTAKDEGIEEYLDGEFAESEKFKLDAESKVLMGELIKAALASPYTMIVNPCSEIPLFKAGGYCVIADVVPLFTENADDAERVFRATTRALMRTNLMNCLYGREVKRTNRIGVSMTGIHEYAWAFFGYGFLDLIDEEKSLDFWMTIARFSRAVDDEAVQYARFLGVAVPHTTKTIKPAGTTSKLFGLSEGCHLPALAEYLRWVQHRNDDPQIEILRAAGYPVRELTSYRDTTIVGFPTQPLIVRMGIGDKLVTAAEATPEEQYKWMLLLEKYWLRGVTEDGELLAENRSGQLSYTLKYDPEVLKLDEFREMLLKYQSQVKCCSVMRSSGETAYEYQPEQPVTKDEFIDILAKIKDEKLMESINIEALMTCSTGACGLDFTPEGVAEKVG